MLLLTGQRPSVGQSGERAVGASVADVRRCLFVACQNNYVIRVLLVV